MSSQPFIVDTIEIDNTKKRYMKFGNGPKTMVIIPGLNATPLTNEPESVAELYSQFTEEFTVYLFDVIDDVPENYSLAQMAEDNVTAMKKLGLSECYLFGTSLGGMQCIYIAGQYPEMVKKVVIGSSVCKADDLLEEVIEKWINLAKKGDGMAFMESSVDYCYSTNSKIKNWVMLTAPGKEYTKEILDRFCKIAGCIPGFDFTKEAKAIKCPALLIGALGDRIMRRETMDYTARLIGCETYYYGHEYGHVVYYETADFQKRLLEFFRS